MVTFIDTKKVSPTMVRGVPKWGRTYYLAGFRFAGLTKGGLLCFQLKPESMPDPKTPFPRQTHVPEVEAVA
jgi:hypothetical protein